MALYSLHCADVPLRNCSLTHSLHLVIHIFGTCGQFTYLLAYLLTYFLNILIHCHSVCCVKLRWTVTGESTVHSVGKGDASMEVSEPGMIEHPSEVASRVAVDGAEVGMIDRPREIASSASQQHLQQRSLRGHSESGSRQSSSLNHRTSPDHIPRMHECWSLEPVRRAHRDRSGHHVGTELSSDLSSVDSLPVSCRPPHGPTSELPNGNCQLLCLFKNNFLFLFCLLFLTYEWHWNGHLCVDVSKNYSPVSQLNE